MRVVHLPGVEGVRVTCDGDEFAAWRPAGTNAIELDLTIGDHTVVVRTGYHGGGAEFPPAKATVTPGVMTRPATMPNPAAISAAASCRCC
jgi:hypothetical protein